MLNRQAYRQESVEMERAILRGQPFRVSGHLVYAAVWQNRLLFPSALELGIHLGIFTPARWYVLLRLFFSVAMFAVFWPTLRTNAPADVKLAGTGLLLLSYCLVVTFTTPYVMTSDFPDALFVAMFIVLSLRRQRWLLLIFSSFAALNRESAAFAAIIWLFIHGMDERRRMDWREAGYSVLVSISTLAFTLLLRYAFGGLKAIGSRTQRLPLRVNVEAVKNLILHPTPSSWAGQVFCMMLPVALWILANRRYLTSVQRRLLGAAGSIAVVSLVFGYIGEPRIFIPSIVIAIFVAVSAESTVQALSAAQRD